MRKILIAGLCLALLAASASAAVAAEPPPTDQQKAAIEKINRIEHGLHPRSGDIALPGAAATLHLGQNYYFLDSKDARTILVDAWGNSPDAASDILGMVFPAGGTFYNRSWAAVVSFEPSGYIPDNDANTADYSQIITDAQSGEDKNNDARKKAGLPPVHLVGWAQPPSYDAKSHTLIWARDIRFGAETDDTLNYDVRALGRRGVLSMNIVANVSQIAQIRQAATALQAAGTFDRGARYQDYQVATDKKAEYGLAGLVAAGLGIAAAQKLGLFALALLFFKKIIALVIAAFVGGFAWLRNRFRRPPPPAAT